LSIDQSNLQKEKEEFKVYIKEIEKKEKRLKVKEDRLSKLEQKLFSKK